MNGDAMNVFMRLALAILLAAILGIAFLASADEPVPPSTGNAAAGVS